MRELKKNKNNNNNNKNPTFSQETSFLCEMVYILQFKEICLNIKEQENIWTHMYYHLVSFLPVYILIS